MRILKLAALAVAMTFGSMTPAVAQQGFGAWSPEKQVRVTADKFVLPKVTIVGVDAPISLGELVDISISPVENVAPLVSTSVVWKVYDYDPAGGVIEKKVREYSDGGISFGTGIRDKKMLIFAIATHLYVVKDGDGKVTEVATRTQVITAGLVIGTPAPPTPPEPPTPPTPPTPPKPLPDGRFKLAQWAFDTGSQVPAASKTKGAAAAASAFRGVIAAVRAGAIKTQEPFLIECKKASDAALLGAGAKQADWQPFGVAIEAKLYSLYHDEKKIVTVSDFADAVEEVCVGLDAVK